MPEFKDAAAHFYSCWVLGKKEGSEKGSNLRRLYSRGAVVGILFCFTLYIYTYGQAIDLWVVTVSYLLTLASLLFFVFVVVAVLFLTGQHFRPNASRLIIDSIISICFTISAFALCYNIHGIEPPGDDGVQQFDHFYFSAVTFSTLGFGDFRPVGISKLFASFEAIIGNLHLGVIVGAAFFATQPDV